MNKQLALAVLALAAIDAHAEDSVAEWRLLGPAASYHFSKTGAYATTSSEWSCYAVTRHNTVRVMGDLLPQTPGFAVTDASTFKTTDLQPGAATGAVAAMLGGSGQVTEQSTGSSSSPPYYMGVGTMTVTGSMRGYNGKELDLVTYRYAECEQDGTVTEKRWHQRNPAIGLSYSVREGGHVDQVFGTLVRDSYGKQGFMAGAGRLWTFGRALGLTLDVGAISGLWYRTNLDIGVNRLSRGVVPYVLPALSVTHDATGLGLDVALAPKVQINGRLYNPTTTLMAQTTWRFRTGERNSSSASVQSSGRDISVSIAATY